MTVKANFSYTTQLGLVNGYRKYTEYRVGDDTPLSLRKTGKYNENPYYASYETIHNPGCRVQQTVYPFSILTSRLSSFYATPGFPTITTPTDLDVYHKLAEKWTNSNFNVGVFVGEGKESLEMIYGRLTSITRAAQALRKKNLGDALRYLASVPRGHRKRAAKRLNEGDLSGSYLELVYGWLPLIRDIYAASELVTLHPRVGVIRSSHVNSGDISVSNYFRGDVYKKKHELRRHVKVAVTREPTLLERLGLSDPAVIAWELVPFSFVVDWFLPIGNYLESLHAAGFLPVSKVVTTSVQQREYHARIVEGQIAYQPAIGGSYTTLVGGSYRYRQTILNRSVGTSLSNPLLLAMKVPKSLTPRWDPTLRQVADASALVHQTLVKLK